MKNIIVEFAPQDHAIINYTNWEGITADRKIQPLHIWFGTTEYHKTPQFLLNAIDLDKDAERDFAMNDIHNINIFYNPLSREEWYYNPYNPSSQLPDFFLGDLSKNNKSELVQEDYIFDTAAARGAGSKLEKLPTVEEAHTSCEILRLRELREKLNPNLLKEIKETLQMALDVIGKGDFEIGSCCCGSPCESHGFGDGHSAVDAGSYYDQMLPMKRIEELLSRLTSEQS